MGTLCTHHAMQSFAQIIDLFGGPAEFARAVGMTPGAAKQAKRRDSINAEWFARTARAAAANDIPVTVDVLAELAERKAAA
jgi:hypothetical protein